jgi:hypothetical protein
MILHGRLIDDRLALRGVRGEVCTYRYRPYVLDGGAEAEHHNIRHHAFRGAGRVWDFVGHFSRGNSGKM